jgi:hypothetical protein
VAIHIVAWLFVFPELVRSQAINIQAKSQGVAWATWLRVYRDCHRDLTEVFGLPGDTFQTRTLLRADRDGDRLAGEHPPLE